MMFIDINSGNTIFDLRTQYAKYFIYTKVIYNIGAIEHKTIVHHPPFIIIIISAVSFEKSNIQHWDRNSNAHFKPS